MSVRRSAGSEQLEVLSFEEFTAELSSWPDTVEANWVSDSPGEISALYDIVHGVLTLWSNEGVSLNWEVLLAGSFAAQYRSRYRDTDTPISFDRAVRLAKISMPCFLPSVPQEDPTDSDSTHVPAHVLLAVDAVRKGRLQELVEQSRSSPLAFRALQELLEDRRTNSLPIPPELLIWALDVGEGTLTMPRSGRGRSTYTNQMRDESIVSAVGILIECGLTASRNEASARESACDAVSLALKAHGVDLAYDGVVKVWAKR